MHHVQRGTGPRLLLIHGLGGSWRSWSTIFDALSAHRTVIAVDLPGHGATPVTSDSGTFVGLVGSVERYIAENDLTGVDIVGSSMGARIVLELARRGGLSDSEQAEVTVSPVRFSCSAPTVTSATPPAHWRMACLKSLASSITPKSPNEGGCGTFAPHPYQVKPPSAWSRDAAGAASPRS